MPLPITDNLRNGRDDCVVLTLDFTDFRGISLALHFLIEAFSSFQIDHISDFSKEENVRVLHALDLHIQGQATQGDAAGGVGSSFSTTRRDVSTLATALFVVQEAIDDEDFPVAAPSEIRALDLERFEQACNLLSKNSHIILAPRP